MRLGFSKFLVRKSSLPAPSACFGVMSELREGSPRASYPKSTGSWVSVAQDKQVLKKYEVNISTSDGTKLVEIPDGILDNATPLWEDFLVGKFLDMAPHVAKVHVIVNKIWKQVSTSPNIDVYEVDSTTMRFRVRDPLIRARILRRGMWNIAEVPMVVSKWSPLAEKEGLEEKSIPLWVFLKQVPMNMFSWEGLSFITSAVGDPVRLHPETAACANFDVAKVFVNADLSKELPKKIRYSKNGSDFEVEFLYPWLPPRCSTCEKWGHLEARCVVNMKNPGTQPQGKSGKVSSTKTVTKASAVVLETKQIEEKEITPAKEALFSDTLMNANIVETIVEESERWTTISPAKASRSPTRNASQEEKESLLVTASKFDVLSSMEEEGDIIENEVSKDEENAPEVDTNAKEQDLVMNTNETEKVSKGRILLKRTLTKQSKDTSETSSYVAKDTVPVTSSRRILRRNQ